MTHIIGTRFTRAIQTTKAMKSFLGLKNTKPLLLRNELAHAKAWAFLSCYKPSHEAGACYRLQSPPYRNPQPVNAALPS